MTRAVDLAKRAVITTEDLTNIPSGAKNLIINGDMRIAQRGTSATKTGSGFGYSLIDRFGVQAEDDGSGYNLSQSTDAPTGFQYSMLLTVTTTDTLDATSDNHCLGQRIEGNNIAHLKWGTSDAETVTLSFWVKSSLTGTFGGALSNAVNSTRAYGFTYTINSANTWEYKTITIPGETTGTWATNNGIGIWVAWSLGANAGRQTTANQWDTIASRQATGVYGEDDVIGTLGATFYITGVQLEVGDTATPFEHRPYDMELARCQRYYTKFIGTQYASLGCGPSESGWSNTPLIFPTAMRSSPTATQSTLIAFNGSNGYSVTGIRQFSPTTTNALIQFYHTASAGQPFIIYLNSASAYLALDAEL